MENKYKVFYKTLGDTAVDMVSSDYRTRFVAEYVQLKIRAQKLSSFTAKIASAKDFGTPMPPHDCPDELLRDQLDVMEQYLKILEQRAVHEHITLPAVQ